MKLYIYLVNEGDAIDVEHLLVISLEEAWDDLEKLISSTPNNKRTRNDVLPKENPLDRGKTKMLNEIMALVKTQTAALAQADVKYQLDKKESED
jgi:hypothetical protein